MKSLREFILKNSKVNIFRHKWDAVSNTDIKIFLRKNPSIKLIKTKGVWIGVTPNKQPVFKYDNDNLDLYSDYTIIDFREGKVEDAINAS